MWSLLLAMSAAALAFTAWLWWRPAPTVPVYYRRTINDVELNWKCDAGHSFVARGQVADRPCAMCDQPAFVITPFECPKHGVTEVAARFTYGADGAPRLSQYRVYQGDWFPAMDSVPCPHCSFPMVRKQTDLPDAVTRGKKKSG